MVGFQGRIVIMNEGIRVHEVQSCLLCGTEGVFIYQGLRDRLFSAPGTWTLMRCPKCDLVWLNPRPVPTDIGKLYGQYFTHDISDFPDYTRNQGLVYHLLRNCWKGFLYLIGLSREVDKLGLMTLNEYINGKLLDVGCGNGQFLAKMRDLGWEVVGVEPDGQAVKVAKERFGLNVYEGTLAEVGFPNNTFDAITMNHVIEHLCDPISTLKECRRVLKPDGKLIIVTPNINALGHRLFKEAWRGLEPPRHLYLFSSCTLRTCVEQAGLQVIKVQTTARSAREIWVASRLIQQNGALPGGSPIKQNLWPQLEELVFQVVEYGWCRVKDTGEEIILIATK